jgi:protease I
MAKIAVILGPEFEDSEFRIPYDRLHKAGHDLTIIGRKRGETVYGKQGNESATIDEAASSCDPTAFDAMLIPGGHSPDNLRIDEGIVDFVREFTRTDKPIAAVCHGPQLLIEADAVRGKRLTSWPSVRKDLINAGADWFDEQVVKDGSLITSRKPQDLEAFTSALLEVL